MSIFDHLARLILSAERSSADSAVTIDLFLRSQEVLQRGSLTPAWEADALLGRIVAERGRICWVLAKGKDLTLSDLLAADSGVPRATFERIYQSARAEGIPFCEKLAMSDVIDVSHVRRVLRDQASSALGALAHVDAQEEVACAIAGIPDVTYDNDFTFGGPEVLQAAIQGSPELMRDLGRLPETYARLGPKLRGAFCFRETESQEFALVPVSAWCRGDLSLGDAFDVAAAGLAATQSTPFVAAGLEPFPLISHGRDTWLCAYREPFLSLFLVDAQAQYLKLLSSLVRERRQDG